MEKSMPIASLSQIFGKTSLIVAFLLLTSGGGICQNTYYVDFDSGSDMAQGLSQATAWKHAPGDPSATGQAGQVTLRPGDTVQFKGGVKYRGSIILQASGGIREPIRYLGRGWGRERAIISGMEQFKVTRKACNEVDICAGIANAGGLDAIAAPVNLSPYSRIRLDEEIHAIARLPALSDGFWHDDIIHFIQLSPQEVSAYNGKVRLPRQFFDQAVGSDKFYDASLILWGMPNLLYAGHILADQSDVGALTVEAAGFAPYNNRGTRIAVVNHPSLIRAKNDFATLGGGRYIVAARSKQIHNSAVLEVGLRNIAFDVNGRSDVVIDGFLIEDFHGHPDNKQSGIAVFSAKKGASRIIFKDNIVRNMTIHSGAGAIQANFIENLSVENNKFYNLYFASGVRVGGNSRHVIVSGNEFERIGRTAIAVLGAEDVVIEKNTIGEIYGVHGNAISVYLENRGVLVKNNLIERAARAITFHGSPEGGPNNLTFTGNLISTDGNMNLGVQSWGRRTRGVSIEDNIVVSKKPYFSIRLDKTDQDVTIRGNIFENFITANVSTASWRVERNVVLSNLPVERLHDGAALAAGSLELRPVLRELFDKKYLNESACTNLAKFVALPAEGYGPKGICRAGP